MSQKLPVNNFEWIKDTSQFNEDFIKTVIKKVMKDIFLKLIFNMLKIFIIFIMIYHFYQKEQKLKKSLREKCFYEVFSGPHTGKYRPEKTPYLDTFHAVRRKACR